MPQVLPGVTHVFHQFTVRTTSREQLLRRLRAGGIGAGVYYPTPLHLLFGEPVAGPLPVSERLAAEVLSLPVRPDLTQAEMNRIAEVVNA